MPGADVGRADVSGTDPAWSSTRRWGNVARDTSGDSWPERQEARHRDAGSGRDTQGRGQGTSTFPGVEADRRQRRDRVGSLLKETGRVTYDVGFVNTASCKSAITYIDGDAGHPALPRLPDRAARREVVVRRGLLPAHLRRAADARASWRSSRTASAGTRCCTRTSRRSSPGSRATRTRCRCSRRRSRRCRPSTRTASTPSTRSRSSSRRSGCSPSCRPSPPYAHKKSVGQPFLYPDNSLSLTENFLRMTFGFPAEPYEIDPTIVKALDLLLILHADHEQNCSTSTVRLVGSAQANLFDSRLGRHQRPVRPAARRRQPGRARDAREDPERRLRRRTPS